jgi:ribosomal protein S9
MKLQPKRSKLECTNERKDTVATTVQNEHTGIVDINVTSSEEQRQTDHVINMMSQKPECEVKKF